MEIKIPQAGIVILVLVLTLILAGCSNPNGEEILAVHSDEGCSVDETIQGMICELNKADNSRSAQIRIQNKISTHYENNSAEVADLMKVILNKGNSDDVRYYFIGLMRSKSANSLTGKISNYDSELASLLVSKDESLEIKTRLGDQIPRALAYHEEDAPEFYEAAVQLLGENDTLANIGVGTISGAFANINRNRSLATLAEYAEDYKSNYKKRPNATIYVLMIFQRTPIENTEEAISYVCKGWTEDTYDSLRPLCYNHLKGIQP
jgi:hypothetical protein